MILPLTQYITDTVIISSMSPTQVKIEVADKAKTSRQNVDLWLKRDKQIFIEVDEIGIKRIYQEPDVITYYQRRETR